jgi:hypothetical protein
MQPEQEAVMKQVAYHLASSTALHILTIGLCYGVFNYHNFDLSIHDIRSGIGFFDQLPRFLQKVTFVLGDTGEDCAYTRPEGFKRVVQSVKDELRRIAKTLVDTPGEQYEVARVCREHGIAPDVCRCGSEALVWRFTAMQRNCKREHNDRAPRMFSRQSDRWSYVKSAK